VISNTEREDINEKIIVKGRIEKYLVSCQNDLLSSSGITRVAFMIRATATISHICSKGHKSSANNGIGHPKLKNSIFHV